MVQNLDLLILQKKTLDLTKQKTDGTIYFDLPYNHTTILNPKNNADKLCASWRILMKVFPVTTNVYLLGSDTTSLEKIYLGEIDYTNN